MSIKIRKTKTRSDLSTKSLTLMNAQESEREICVGSWRMIRGLSGASRLLALRVVSCFYLVAFAVSALASSWKGLSTVLPPLTIATTLRRTIQFILMTEPVFAVWMKSATCPISDLQFHEFSKTALKQNRNNNKTKQK